MTTYTSATVDGQVIGGMIPEMPINNGRGPIIVSELSPEIKNDLESRLRSSIFFPDVKCHIFVDENNKMQFKCCYPNYSLLNVMIYFSLNEEDEKFIVNVFKDIGLYFENINENPFFILKKNHGLYASHEVMLENGQVKHLISKRTACNQICESYFPLNHYCKVKMTLSLLKLITHYCILSNFLDPIKLLAYEWIMTIPLFSIPYILLSIPKPSIISKVFSQFNDRIDYEKLRLNSATFMLGLYADVFYNSIVRDFIQFKVLFNLPETIECSQNIIPRCNNLHQLSVPNLSEILKNPEYFPFLIYSVAPYIRAIDFMFCALCAWRSKKIQSYFDHN